MDQMRVYYAEFGLNDAYVGAFMCEMGARIPALLARLLLEGARRIHGAGIEWAFAFRQASVFDDRVAGAWDFCLDFYISGVLGLSRRPAIGFDYFGCVVWERAIARYVYCMPGAFESQGFGLF